MSLEARQFYAPGYIQDVWNPEVRPSVECGEGVTRQSMAEECDINRIIARYEKTGVISHVVRDSGVFADVSDCGDYREALDRVKRADAYFMQLPPKVRLAFDNDPAVFLDAVADPARRKELEELGVLEPSPATVGSSTVPGAVGQAEGASE